LGLADLGGEIRRCPETLFYQQFIVRENKNKKKEKIIKEKLQK